MRHVQVHGYSCLVSDQVRGVGNKYVAITDNSIIHSFFRSLVRSLTHHIHSVRMYYTYPKSNKTMKHIVNNPIHWKNMTR